MAGSRAQKAFLAVQGTGVGAVIAAALATWTTTPSGPAPGYLRSLGVAVVGYACLLVWLGYRTDPDRVRVLGRFGYGWFTTSTALLWAACAVRAPLFAHATAVPVWVAVDLIVGVAATLALTLGVLGERARSPRGWWEASVVGALALLLHVGAVDAAVGLMRVRGV